MAPHTEAAGKQPGVRIMRHWSTVHAPYHWIAVALVLAFTLLMLSEAHGQHTGAAAVFEGRPAMSGAQAGQGAMAGPPQGGVGVQGTQDAAVSISRRPAAVTTPRSEMRAAKASTSDSILSPNRGDIDVAPRKDSGIAKDQRSAVRKTTRAAKKALRKPHAPVIEGEVS
jgi:hypothetical protein